MNPYSMNPYQSYPPQTMIQVLGEGAAKAYPVPPGTVLPLWDTETQTIYVKSVDANGFPTITTLDYTIREEKATDDLKALSERIRVLEEKIGGMTSEPVVPAAPESK